ncbi:uncharacterized protein LOC111885947 [Lactuca sativa]|uniref:uncharacterized protein LOC111885947 n=1 Tax=Lactuca sativa TaxID=4236 RepID=UPI000CD843AA|nr:uncharacterized protein LOC111885947 [Lactuca sativa]
MSSLEAYCRRLKYLSSQLNDVDCPVNEKRLVLQLVRGLPSEFDTVGAYINQTLPPWDTACSMLQLEIQRQRARDSHSSTEIVATVEHDPPANSNFRRGKSGNKVRPHQQRNTNRRAPASASPSRPNYPSSGRQPQTQLNKRRGFVSNQTRPTWAGYPPSYWTQPLLGFSTAVSISHSSWMGLSLTYLFYPATTKTNKSSSQSHRGKPT